MNDKGFCLLHSWPHSSYSTMKGSTLRGPVLIILILVHISRRRSLLEPSKEIVNLLIDRISVLVGFALCSLLPLRNLHRHLAIRVLVVAATVTAALRATLSRVAQARRLDENNSAFHAGDLIAYARRADWQPARVKDPIHPWPQQRRRIVAIHIHLQHVVEVATGLNAVADAPPRLDGHERWHEGTVRDIDLEHWWRQRPAQSLLARELPPGRASRGGSAADAVAAARATAAPGSSRRCCSFGR